MKWRWLALLYKFKTLELNGLKGMIGERLARSFVRNKLAPKLCKEEGWDHVLLSNNDYKRHSWTWNTKLFSFDEFRVDFIVHGFFANRRLLTKYANVVSVLTKKHCSPDGLLLKLQETGRKKRLKEKTRLSITRFRVEEGSREGDTLKFPVVDGGLEVLEIKCGRKARLMGNQKETYNDLIAKGYPLRMIKVRIVSFDLNQFLVEETKFERFL